MLRDVTLCCTKLYVTLRDVLVRYAFLRYRTSLYVAPQRHVFSFISLGHQPGTDLGPVISPASKERICNLVQSGIEEGAKVGISL